MSGEFKEKVCKTLSHSDYTVIFQGDDGREKRIIRCRHFENEDDNEREEIIAVMTGLTNEIKKGNLYIGLTESDCKPLIKNASYAM